MKKHGKKIRMYAFKLSAAISDDFGNSPEMEAHILNTYIHKTGMLSLQFSEMRPAFLKLLFQWGSFELGLIRVGAHLKLRLIVVSRLIHLFCTYIKHCVLTFVTKILNLW